MALDYVHRQLYYSHVGSVSINGISYTWHKIETVKLDPPYTVRTIETFDLKPRAVTFDLDQGSV